MRTRTALVTVLLLAAATTGCNGDSDTRSKPTPSAVPSSSHPATEEPSPTATATATATGSLPSLVGRGLQDAQDAAQAAGYYNLDSHDSLGRGRMQILDRSWKVCSQTPTGGRHSTNVQVDFGVVKLDETCPAADEKKPAKASGVMPNLIGKSVKVARQTLPSGTSIDVRDSTGQNRWVIIESNWQVCHLSPGVGAKLNRPVVISAVKFGERC